MKKRIVWISKDGSVRSMDELDLSHLVAILNLIERGVLSKGGGIRTATYRDLVNEAHKRGLVSKATKAWGPK